MDQWLALLMSPPKKAIFNNYEFPSDVHRQQYLNTISQRSEYEVSWLIRKFLIESQSLGVDEWSLKYFTLEREHDNKEETRKTKSEYHRRLLLWTARRGKGPPPWEGITWLLDLLPDHPNSALTILDSYILAHIQFLPDGRINGLLDAAELIRAKYIGLPDSNSETIELLMDISPRQFECLVERTYHKMGYETELTSTHTDGGRDILARKTEPGHREELRIECKRHHRPVGVPIVRAVLGVISHEKVNKGAIVTTSTFTRKAKELAKSNPRLELIPGNVLVQLMNKFLGSNWPLHIEFFVSESLIKKNFQ